MKLKLFLTLLLGACISLPAFAQQDATKAPVTDSRSSLRHTPEETHPLFQTTPIAYGYVFEGASIGSGSGNFSVTWNSTYKWYSIAITGVDYYYSSYSTVVTTTLPSGNTNCQTDSVSGDLLVLCYTSSGAATQADFGFILF
jgi:hypothetical protein